MALSEVVKTVLAAAEAGPPLWDSPIDVVRNNFVVTATAAGTPGPDVPSQDVDADGVPVRVYEPARAAAGAVLYLHGGGWTLGSVASHDPLCRRLAAESGRRVVSVEYRLAPEHPFPAALDDTVTAARWAHAQFGDPLAVAGDSAGGNLAVALCLVARDGDGPPISSQALLYPALDATRTSDSYRENASGYLLTADTMRWFWENYVPGGSAGPLASVADATDVSGLPPALVIVAGYDPLRDEGVAFAERLQAAGVDARLVNYEDATHFFVGLDLLFPTEAAAAMAAMAEFLSS